jgi:hypothetical protein
MAAGCDAEGEAACGGRRGQVIGCEGLSVGEKLECRGGRGRRTHGRVKPQERSFYVPSLFFFFILFSIREIIAILLFSLVKSLPNHKG